jgi:NADH-quinone oxidoreductase subunit L
VPAVGHLLSHAAFKALLFLGAGAVILAVGSNLMADMGGLRRAMPVTFLTMTVGFAALAGIPPTSGFFSKDAVIAAAEHAGTGTGWLVLTGLLLTALLTAAYATRAWLLTFFGAAREGGSEASPVLTVPLVALAVPALLLGFGGLWWPELRPEWGSSLLSVVLAGVGATVSYVVWRADPVRDPAVRLGRLRGLFASTFRTDDLYERTVARGVTALAVDVVGVDDHVVGRAVTGAGRGASRLGGLLRLTQNGNPQLYLTGLLAGVLLIAVGVVTLR